MENNLIIQIILFPLTSKKRRQVTDSVRRSSSASIASRKAEINNGSEDDDRLFDDHYTPPSRRRTEIVDGPQASGGPSPEGTGPGVNRAGLAVRLNSSAVALTGLSLSEVGSPMYPSGHLACTALQGTVLHVRATHVSSSHPTRRRMACILLRTAARIVPSSSDFSYTEHTYRVVNTSSLPWATAPGYLLRRRSVWLTKSVDFPTAGSVKSIQDSCEIHKGHTPRRIPACLSQPATLGPVLHLAVQPQYAELLLTTSLPTGSH